MKYYLKSEQIFLENRILKNAYLLIEDEIIKDIFSCSENKSLNKNLKIIDLGSKIIAPGLIDLHIHGAVGKDVMDADYESLNSISQFLAKNGVTSFLATTLTSPLPKIKSALQNVKLGIEKGVAGAKILGIYLEGPYLTREHNGAHPVEFMREINLQEIDELIDLSGNNIMVVALAPEKDLASQITEYLTEKGIKVTIAHTNASYEETKKTINCGANIATHTFNGMTGLHHRAPGAVGAILSSAEVYSELIADKIHVHPAVIKILYKVKNNKLMLISDCIRAGGLADGNYKLGELDIKVHDSIARTETGSLAGSTLKIREAILNIKDSAELSLFDSLKLATLTPAAAIGLAEEIGSIEIGKKADLIAIDKKMNVYLTIINGKIIYNNL